MKISLFLSLSSRTTTFSFSLFSSYQKIIQASSLGLLELLYQRSKQALFFELPMFLDSKEQLLGQYLQQSSLRFITIINTYYQYLFISLQLTLTLQSHQTLPCSILLYSPPFISIHSRQLLSFNAGIPLIPSIIIFEMRLILLFCALCSILSVELIEVFNHDISCYTQGLTFLTPSSLLESCGHYRESKVRKLIYNQMLSQYQRDPDTSLPKEVFGEGITIFKDNIYVLTWREHRVFVFDKNFTLLKEIQWDREGWGLTNNDTHMFISDGGSTIFVVNESFTVLEEIKVTLDGRALRNLNELEFYKGSILANIYYQNSVAEINLDTGAVKLHDFKPIITSERKTNKIAEVLNGIAYDPENDRLLVTGKYWKHMYKVEL